MATEHPPAAIARRLMRTADRASLATTLAPSAKAEAGAGSPYASLVLVAADHDAAPILLLSGLAQHTRNLAHDPRLSLLFDGTAGLDDPLTGARVSVIGRAERTADPRLRARFLARHPSAAMYADFGDFAFYAVAVGRAHLVAGFGRIDWVDRDALLARPVPVALAEAEAGILAHMNEDHADAIELYATRLLRLPGVGWRMTGLDAEGLDLRRGGLVARLDFANPVADAAGARAELVRLVGAARART